MLSLPKTGTAKKKRWLLIVNNLYLEQSLLIPSILNHDIGISSKDHMIECHVLSQG